MLLSQILTLLYYTCYTKKSHPKRISLNSEIPVELHLNSLIDHALYEIFKVILSISSENIKHWLITENRITCNIKRGYYLELLTPKLMELLGSTKSKINKNGNGKKMPRLEITEVMQVHCNVFNNDYQQSSRVLYSFVPNKSFGQLLDISPKNFMLLKTLSEYFQILKYGLLIKILICYR